MMSFKLKLSLSYTVSVFKTVYRTITPRWTSSLRSRLLGSTSLPVLLQYVGAYIMTKFVHCA